jgi:hypothetical protein
VAIVRPLRRRRASFGAGPRECPCGGTGRRARLKIEFRKECWFDSGQGHQPSLASRATARQASLGLSEKAVAPKPQAKADTRCRNPISSPTSTQTHLRIPAARFRPDDASSLSLDEKRAQGMPGARRTHCLTCKKEKDARRLNTGTPKSPGTPCAMVLRLLRALPGVSGLLASVARRSSQRT